MLSPEQEAAYMPYYLGKVIQSHNLGRADWVRYWAQKAAHAALEVLGT